jgi:uncharacterized Zn finger protein (UPF0148 family)
LGETWKYCPTCGRTYDGERNFKAEEEELMKKSLKLMVVLTEDQVQALADQILGKLSKELKKSEPSSPPPSPPRRRKSRISEDDVKLAIKMRKAGSTWKEIAKTLDCNDATIFARVKNYL